MDAFSEKVEELFPNRLRISSMCKWSVGEIAEGMCAELPEYVHWRMNLKFAKYIFKKMEKFVTYFFRNSSFTTAVGLGIAEEFF